jgi:hypothetical protein
MRALRPIPRLEFSRRAPRLPVCEAKRHGGETAPAFAGCIVQLQHSAVAAKTFRRTLLHGRQYATDCRGGRNATDYPGRVAPDENVRAHTGGVSRARLADDGLSSFGFVHTSFFFQHFPLKPARRPRTCGPPGNSPAGSAAGSVVTCLSCVPRRSAACI